jgi:hypothetical protein
MTNARQNLSQLLQDGFDELGLNEPLPQKLRQQPALLRL